MVRDKAMKGNCLLRDLQLQSRNLYHAHLQLSSWHEVLYAWTQEGNCLELHNLLAKILTMPTYSFLLDLDYMQSCMSGIKKQLYHWEPAESVYCRFCDKQDHWFWFTLHPAEVVMEEAVWLYADFWLISRLISISFAHPLDTM